MTADTIVALNEVAAVRSTPDKRLIRAGLLMLLFMTTAFGAATWNAMQELSIHVKAIPVVLFVVVCVLVVRLFAAVDEMAAVQHAPASAAKSVFAANAEIQERSLDTPQITRVAQVPLETRDEIWKYWDENGTGRQSVEYVSCTYSISTNVVQHLLERYDVRWRKQVATLYCDNPSNEYMAYNGVEETQIAEDAHRLKSGLPIYPVAGIWLCSDCRKRPCCCDVVTPNGSRA